MQQKLEIGSWVDIYRRPTTKQFTGWRGPCVLIAHLGEGFVTVRWQSVYLDVPVHHVRPHVMQRPDSSLNNSGAPVAPSDTPAIAAAPAADAIADAVSFIQDLALFEKDHDCEACDQVFLSTDTIYSLQRISMTIESGTQHIHAVQVKPSGIQSSLAAQRDGFVIYNLGKALAEEKGVQHYQGVVLGSGRRHLPTLQGIQTMHVFSWTGDTNSELREDQFPGGKSIDLLKQGLPPKKLPDHHFIMILEGQPENKSQLDIFTKEELLDNDLLDEPFGPSRLRIPENLQTEQGTSPEDDDPGPSISERYAESVKSSDPDISYILFDGRKPTSQEKDIISDILSQASTTEEGEVFWSSGDSSPGTSDVEAFFSHSFMVHDEVEEF